MEKKTARTFTSNFATKVHAAMLEEPFSTQCKQQTNRHTHTHTYKELLRWQQKQPNPSHHNRMCVSGKRRCLSGNRQRSLAYSFACVVSPVAPLIADTRQHTLPTDHCTQQTEFAKQCDALSMVVTVGNKTTGTRITPPFAMLADGPSAYPQNAIYFLSKRGGLPSCRTLRKGDVIMAPRDRTAWMRMLSLFERGSPDDKVHDTHARNRGHADEAKERCTRIPSQFIFPTSKDFRAEPGKERNTYGNTSNTDAQMCVYIPMQTARRTCVLCWANQGEQFSHAHNNGTADEMK